MSPARDRDGGYAGDPERGSTAKQRQPGPKGIAQITSADISNSHNSKPLNKWGSASIERMLECPNCGSRFRCGCSEYFEREQGQARVPFLGKPHA